MNYVKGVENENAEQNQLVDVLVARGPIPKGTSADAAIAAEQITVDKRRRADLPAQAVRRNAEIAEQVASFDLGGGEIITSTMFVADTDLTGSKSTSLDKGNVAITISVDETAGVAGLIQPGDSINILADVNVNEVGPISKTVTPDEEAYLMQTPSVYAFQDVKVLAVGQSLGEPVAATPTAEGAPPAEESASGGSGLITVQLPPDKAALLASVRDASLYLTLNRPDYEPTPQPFVPFLPILPGETATSPYPEAPGGNDGQ
jgi:Flp pilus assembly protein CpaB